MYMTGYEKPYKNEFDDFMGGIEMPPDISEIDADISKLNFIWFCR